ncbi:ribosome recycling factor [Coxiella-like endosymbiont of Amblyomma americanum]|nr:ribosome recycling factor [Coxiella-like endosymbiont of Amblyomma americanum]AUJ58652.1 ribosome recycling factor [Coxiella-like endosymbiont of Amblyomma americanum]
MINNGIVNKTKVRMEKSVETLKTGLTKLRAGRAHPSLLEYIKVQHHNSGVNVPLSQAATISVENSHMLIISPWEENMIDKIKKAVQSANPSLNPFVAGTIIRVPLPPLTEERRREFTRIVRDEAEVARVTIRNIRREANNNLKKLLKKREINEDEERRIHVSIQKLTDEKILEINKIISKKIADLMSL